MAQCNPTPRLPSDRQRAFFKFCFGFNTDSHDIYFIFNSAKNSGLSLSTQLSRLIVDYKIRDIKNVPMSWDVFISIKRFARAAYHLLPFGVPRPELNPAPLRRWPPAAGARFDVPERGAGLARLPSTARGWVLAPKRL